MAKKLTLTPWFRMDQKPVREGEYEGRDKRTGLRLVVYWRKLTDEPKPGWYYQKGILGPFNLWADATKDMTAWRGVLKSGSGK
jgi:hypothetical protein